MPSFVMKLGDPEIRPLTTYVRTLRSRVSILFESRILTITRSYRQHLYHLPCELRTNPRLFMLEINENIIPAVLCANKVNPLFDVNLPIILATKPKISVIARRNLRCREIFGVGDTKRNIA